MFEHDQFQYNDTIYNVDYRPIEDDVSLEQNAFQTTEFKPNGKSVWNSGSSKMLEWAILPNDVQGMFTTWY